MTRTSAVSGFCPRSESCVNRSSRGGDASISLEPQKQSNGVVAHLEAEAAVEEKDEAEADAEFEVADEEEDGEGERDGDGTESDDVRTPSTMLS